MRVTKKLNVVQRIRQTAAIGRWILLAIFLGSTAAQAEVMFDTGFEDPVVDPLFPIENGEYILPNGPATDEFNWFLAQLQTGANPSDQDIEDHFAPSWFNGFTVQETRNFLDSVRANYPNAILTDLITVTPMEIVGLITGDNNREGFVVFRSRFANSGIHYLFVSNYGFGDGTTVYPADQNLNMMQAADKFETLSSAPALLVGRINADHQCEVIEGRNENSLRATASIFKIWVLGAVAQAVAENIVGMHSAFPLDANELAFGGAMVDEPLGTLFTIDEYARMMLGVSDNTATDMLHGLLGRDRVNAIVTAFEHTTPTILTPFLGISEQFHLFFSFSLADATNYVNGSESFQQQFLLNDIEPLGSILNSTYPFNNESLYIAGSWQASPMDVCRAFAHHRRWHEGSDEMQLADAALGASVAQPNVRNEWDRVWYKGGNLESGVNGQLVLTHAWMLENSGQNPYVIVAMSNQQAGGIDVFDVQSITGRLLELVADLP